MLTRRTREYLFGGMSVIGILLIFVAPGWLIEAAVAVLAGGVTYWVATCPVDRLRLPNGTPRPLLFSLFVVGISAHLSVVKFLSAVAINRLTLTASLLLMAAGLVIGLVRVLWHPGLPPLE